MLLRERYIDQKITVIERKVDMDLRIKSRCLWIKAGDQYSSLFHYLCKERNKRNTIKELSLENGRKINDPELIKKRSKLISKNSIPTNKLSQQTICSPLAEKLHSCYRKNIIFLFIPLLSKKYGELCGLYTLTKPQGRTGSLSVSTEAVGTSRNILLK